MTIYEKNMQAIREHHVRLHEYLETAQPEQSVEIRYEAAEDEMLYPIVTKGGLEYRLNSKYNPKEASMQYVSQFEKEGSYSVFFLLGFGDGRSIEALAQTLDETMTLIVYEPSVAIFQIKFTFWKIPHMDLSSIWIYNKSCGKRIIHCINIFPFIVIFLTFICNHYI